MNNSVFSQLMKDNFMGIGILSAHTEILLGANEKFLFFLGITNFSLENIAGKKLGDILPGWEGSDPQKYLSIPYQTGKTAYCRECRIVTAGFSESYWDITVVPMTEEGTIKHITVMVEDVTNRVENRNRADEQAKIIEQQNEQLETILENISDSIMIVNKDGDYIRNIRRTSTGEFYYETMGPIEKRFEQGKYFDESGQVLVLETLPIYRVWKGETIKNYRYVYKSPIGDIHLSASGKPIYDDKGEFLMGILCGWDITEHAKYEEIRKAQQTFALEKEREQKEILERIIIMKDEFLSVISHEFKTPLTVINSAIQALEVIYRDELTDKVKSFVKKIKQNSFRQLRLVNNLLDITRANAGHIHIVKKDHDVVFHTSAIVESVQSYADQKGIVLTFSSTLKAMQMGLDEEKYERILLNLLSNAIKFTPAGKRIQVKVSSRKGFILITVKDQGIGIPKDKQNMIFERFGQVDSSLSRQAEGTGIGLSLVKMLVEAMDGTITLESTEGKGSTFGVLLPAVKVEEKPEGVQLIAGSDNRLIHSTAIEFSDIYLNG